MKRIFRLFVLLFAVIVSSAIVCFGAVGQSGNLKSEATVQNELLVPMQIAATTAETIESNQDTFEYTWPSVMAAAEAGNPKAMCLVANHYCWGEGVCDDFRGGKNYKKALEWYRRAAALNHTEAMRKLGDMYSAGKGVIGSDREARKWYEMASKNGDTDAMIALGDSYKYALNKDVAEDRNKALEWYLEAARRGEKKANFSVGLMLHYMSGDGNKEESYIWLARAALGGSSTAQKLLVDNGIHSNQFKEYAARKTRIDDGTYTSASASSATSSKAAATSKANTETASTTPQSLTPQQCYAKGNALYEQRKYDEAIPWLERAAEAKIRSAYMPLAKCYHIEGHSKSNPKKAWTYYAHCVGGDNPHSRDYWYASFMLGQMFTTGYGCEKNYDSALFFLREFRKYTTPENYDTADKLINEVLALQRGGTTQHSTGTSSNAQQTTARTTSTNHAASTVGKPAYGQFPQAAVGISTGNATIGTNSAANVLANDSRLSEVRQLFSYSGTDRQGQTDASGKVIQNELSTSDALGETHYVFYEDKYCFITTLSTCLQCYGNRVCRLCNGHGSFVHPYLQQLSPCKVCGGTGVCLSCNGQGYRLTAKMWRPGEAEAYVQALREVKRSHYSGSSSSHSHSHSSSSSGVCPDCGGTGYRPEVSPVAMPSNVASYHHTAGYECYICGRTTDHYHHRCTTCKQH